MEEILFGSLFLILWCFFVLFIFKSILIFGKKEKSYQITKSEVIVKAVKSEVIIKEDTIPLFVGWVLIQPQKLSKKLKWVPVITGDDPTLILDFMQDNIYLGFGQLVLPYGTFPVDRTYSIGKD